MAVALAGAVTPAGALAKKVAKLLGGTITPAGALALAKFKTLVVGGTITPAATLALKTAKHPAADLRQSCAERASTNILRNS